VELLEHLFSSSMLLRRAMLYSEFLRMIFVAIPATISLILFASGKLSDNLPDRCLVSRAFVVAYFFDERGKMLRNLLTILFASLLIFNTLDYLTTIYCLENIPNAYETNPWIKTPDEIFRFKILYGIPVGIAGIILAFLSERLRMRFRAKINSRFIDFWYYLWLAFVLVVFIDYIFTVAGNVSVIIRYG